MFRILRRFIFYACLESLSQIKGVGSLIGSFLVHPSRCRFYQIGPPRARAIGNFGHEKKSIPKVPSHVKVSDSFRLPNLPS